MGQSLKIAIYSGEIPSTTFIERLIVGLSKTDHSVYLFGSKTKKVSYHTSVKVIAYTHSQFRKLFHLLKYSLLLTLFRLKDKRRLDRILKQRSKNLLYSKVKSYPVLWHRPDIFHLQWAKGLEEWAWVQEFGMKLVLSLRGAHINYSPIADEKLASMYRTYFPKVDGFHAVSEAIGEEAARYGASLESIKVVYSGLDLEDFKTAPKKPNSVFQIISIGRPHWKKGYACALDASKILKDKNCQFHYTVVGGANDIELTYQVHDLELQTCVTLLGQNSFEDVKRLLQSADLLLLPSVEEGIANVVLEAMALGTLVLSTECGGMNEVILNGANGFLTPVRKPKEMAASILEIIDLPERKQKEIREKAINTVAEQHTELSMVEGILDLYKEVYKNNSN